MMKDSKYSKIRQPNFNGGVRSPQSKVWGKLHINVVLIILAGVSALVILCGRESSDHQGSSTGLIDDFRRVMIFYPAQEDLQPSWNHSSYSFKPSVSDWDEQRVAWMAENPSPRPRAGGKPYVMMVSGSYPKECDPVILSHLLVRSSKNKLDYSRVHDIELFYNMGEPDENFSDWWVKLPVIRMLMLQHPQMEWIWWIDADAVITDLSFEPPYEELEHDNLVLYGEEQHVYDRRTWTGLSTANFMIRNCQWSLDLLAEWASMGANNMREESGSFQSEVLTDRPTDFSGDDQSSLVALLAQDKRNPMGMQRWAPMVKLVKETEYYMVANWTEVAPKLEELSLHEHDEAVPFVTHFTGCLPSCRVKQHMKKHFLDTCVEQMGRAFDFADNQVYKEFGFEPRKLGDHLSPLDKKPSVEAAVEKEFTADGEEIFRMMPRFTDWDARRLAWMQQNPPTKKDEVILVSGSAPKSCKNVKGNYLLLWGLKNLIDYGRKNDVTLFYNDAATDKNLTGWWSKLPLVKMLMIHNPGTEWIWWLDSDALITDMDYRLDFARYNASGYNMVMYGTDHEVYDLRHYNGINTGNFLLRNCQWSLDLFDRWASFGATQELRESNVALLDEALSNRPPKWEADDQSILVYLLILEREKWGSQTCFETTILMSGWWLSLTEKFRDEHPVEERPFVTHFAGCKPCRDPNPSHEDEVMVRCLKDQEMTYNFADNQVLQQYGLRHVHLTTTKLLDRSTLVNDNNLYDPQVMEAAETMSEDVDSVKVEKVDPSQVFETSAETTQDFAKSEELKGRKIDDHEKEEEELEGPDQDDHNN
ncbi:unnamed protein product [Calypogeia fissa]